MLDFMRISELERKVERLEVERTDSMLLQLQISQMETKLEKMKEQTSENMMLHLQVSKLEQRQERMMEYLETWALAGNITMNDIREYVDEEGEDVIPEHIEDDEEVVDFIMDDGIMDEDVVTNQIITDDPHDEDVVQQTTTTTQSDEDEEPEPEVSNPFTKYLTTIDEIETEQKEDEDTTGYTSGFASDLEDIKEYQTHMGKSNDESAELLNQLYTEYPDYTQEATKAEEISSDSSSTETPKEESKDALDDALLLETFGMLTSMGQTVDDTELGAYSPRISRKF